MFRLNTISTDFDLNFSFFHDDMSQEIKIVNQQDTQHYT